MSRFDIFSFAALALVMSWAPLVAAEEQAAGDVPLAEPWTFTRLYADSNGASHFDDEVLTFRLVDFAPPAPAISLSEAFSARTMAVMSSPPGWHGDWHPAPQRQFIFILTGQLEVTVSDGEARTFSPGFMVLVEDTFGKGHLSKVTGKERCYCVVVPLAEEQKVP